jgi:hypothetical protein
MRRIILLAALALGAPGAAVAAGDASVEWGKHVSIVGGCHDCHTVGYNESGGKIDPVSALKGSPVGFQGPWGTTYPANLRLTAKDKTEDEFVEFIKTFKTRPPMPYYNVNALEEKDVRSLYQYIKSLGDPGDPVPAAAAPGDTPKTPYIVFVPVLPK